MKGSEIKRTEVNDLLKAYANAAAAHGRASTIGDYQTANAQHDVIAAIYRELRARDESARRTLLSLLDHKDSAVRGWAASHALEFAPEEGQRVLLELSHDAGIWRLTAETILKQWRNGTLSFP
jgi:hypothetical protein